MVTVYEAATDSRWVRYIVRSGRPYIRGENPLIDDEPASGDAAFMGAIAVIMALAAVLGPIANPSTAGKIILASVFGCLAIGLAITAFSLSEKYTKMRAAYFDKLVRAGKIIQQ